MTCPWPDPESGVDVISVSGNASGQSGRSAGKDESFQIAAELRRILRAVMSGVHPGGHAEGGDRPQYWVLGVLAEGPRRMSDLAEQAQTSTASLTGIVDRLQQRGLVERLRSREDRRVVEVFLTAAGRAELESVHRALVASLEGVLRPLSAQERRELLRLLRTVTADLPQDHARGVRCGDPE